MGVEEYNKIYISTQLQHVILIRITLDFFMCIDMTPVLSLIYQKHFIGPESTIKNNKPG